MNRLVAKRSWGHWFRVCELSGRPHAQQTCTVACGQNRADKLWPYSETNGFQIPTLTFTPSDCFHLPLNSLLPVMLHLSVPSVLCLSDHFVLCRKQLLELPCLENHRRRAVGSFIWLHGTTDQTHRPTEGGFRRLPPNKKENVFYFIVMFSTWCPDSSDGVRCWISQCCFVCSFVLSLLVLYRVIVEYCSIWNYNVMASY